MTQRILAAAALVGCFGISSSADAGPSQGEGEPLTLFGKPVNQPPQPSEADLQRRREAFQQHLRDNDLVMAGDVLVPRARLEAPSKALPDHDDTWHDEPHYHTIFLNFFGGMLTSGTNASEMQSGCVGAAPIDYPGFTGGEAFALAIIQIFEAAMEPYAVRIAYDEVPPAHLPYSMVMMGGTPDLIGQEGTTLGVSCSSDCGDVWWRDTTFAFTEQSGNPGTLGNTALQEAAHAFGLDHIDGQQHIMYPFASSGTKVWSNTCTPYNDATGGISCTYIHEIFCPEGGAQNDDAELLAFFGPDAPDMEPPQVTITAPADGDQLDAGDSVKVEAEVTDNVIGMGWRLVVMPPNEDPQIVNAYDWATSWNLSGLTEGQWTFRVEAVDHDRNEGFDEVTIQVGQGQGSGSGTSGGDEGTGTGGGMAETGGTFGGEETGTVDTAPEMPEPDPQGCGCRQQSADDHPMALAWMLLLGGLLRRRGA